VLPFWISIGLLSLAQGVVVAVVRAPARALRTRLTGRHWAAVPPLSVIAFVLIARAAQSASAQGLTYLALVAVPPLAAIALAWFLRGGRPPAALLVAPLFALAWAARGSLGGEAAALVLSALSCVALGALLGALTPPRWLAAGIFAMALADTALVMSDQLQRPNNALNAAHPVAGLPRLQSELLGSAVMGYGDLFIAGALGGLLAIALGRSVQLRGAALTVAFAWLLDLLFFLVDELPATVPVALALGAVLLTRARTGAAAESVPPRWRRSARAPQGSGSAAARPEGARPAAARSPAAPRSPAR
jgi:hypothetical protein